MSHLLPTLPALADSPPPSCPHCGNTLARVDSGFYVIDIHGVCDPCGYSIPLHSAADESGADYSSL